MPKNTAKRLLISLGVYEAGTRSGGVKGRLYRPEGEALDAMVARRVAKKQKQREVDVVKAQWAAFTEERSRVSKDAWNYHPVWMSWKSRQYYDKLTYDQKREKWMKLERNPHTKILKRLRARLWKVTNGMVSHTMIDLLGCSVEEFRQHIESQFVEGMSWDNYGVHGWHIDHIEPCASFDLTSDTDRRKCWHYSNLRPLWAHTNLSKSSKVNGVKLKSATLKSLTSNGFNNKNSGTPPLAIK